MESLSRPVRGVKIPLTVAIPDYLRDHRYDGRIVLPAAEALQILARSLPPDLPACDPRHQEGAAFAHLLLLDADADSFSAFHEIALFSDGRRLSRLTTLRTDRQTRWTRCIEHVSVSFRPIGGKKGGKEERSEKGPARGSGGAILGSDFHGSRTDYSFSCQRLYNDLVPFGPAYHNVVGEVCLTPTEASAEVSGGDYPDAVGPLGSPFTFDAALHVACAWGQRYRNLVAFPVGFDSREIVLPTRNGETYICRVFPLPDEGATLCFDVRLYGEDRRPVEIIGGLKMRDISGGRLKPPAWVRKGV